jgi:hypothetical protein
MATLFPRALHFYAEAKVSINRIQVNIDTLLN